MMKKQLLAIGAAVLALTGLIAGCGKEEDVKERTLRELPEGFRYGVKYENHSVNYTDSEGKEISLFGQICAPKDDGKYPAVILSHGFNGHYSDFPTECKAFAERGYVCYAFDFCGAQSGGQSTGRTAAENTPLMGYSIGAKFIESVQDLDPFAVIGNFKKDVCIVWGDRDALVARKYIDNAVTAYGETRVDLTVIPGAGHGFGGTALDTAVEKVRAFLEAHTYE